MTAVKPDLDAAAVGAFLRGHLGTPVEDVRGLRGGEISTAFAYAVAGERYVIRFSANQSAFLHDRYAFEHFAPSGAATLRGPDLIVTTAVRRGSPVAALAAEASEPGIGLVVVATHGRSGLQAIWVGSVTADLLSRVRVPVLLLRIPEGKVDEQP